MATFNENIRKIRGEAIYGPEMREAIAQALEQSPAGMDVILEEIRDLVENRELFIYLIPLGDDDFRLQIQNAS